MKQYQDLLQRIIDEGCEKESGRSNMPHVWGIEDGEIKMDLREGFPLLTTKKMPWKMIVHELLWFLRGETNIKYLVDNNVNIWCGDAFRWYQKYAKDNNSEVNTILKSNPDGSFSMFTYNEFVEKIKLAKDNRYLPRYGEYMFGDLGKVYGFQWRKRERVFNDEMPPDFENKIEIVDQVKNIIDGLQTNPYSRYHILDAWNPLDLKDMALPPCHLLYQFIIRPLSTQERKDWFFTSPIYRKHMDKVLDGYNVPKFYLNLNLYQHSCDSLLGIPFNIASMSLLLMIVAQTCNMIPKQSKWIGGDVHLYLDHIPVAKEQIGRTPKKLPQMIIKKDLKNLDDILTLTIEDFELQNYESDDKLFGELHTGYVK